MLYDPKWDKPSLAGFIAWLESQPPRKKYDWEDCRGACLMGQYMTAVGVEWGPDNHIGGSKNYLRTCDTVLGRDAFIVLGREPWTFGAALERARKLTEHHS